MSTAADPSAGNGKSHWSKSMWFERSYSPSTIPYLIAVTKPISAQCPMSENTM